MMKKQSAAAGVDSFNQAAFRVCAGELRGGRLQLCVEASLARLFGGASHTDAGSQSCSVYSCTAYTQN